VSKTGLKPSFWPAGPYAGHALKTGHLHLGQLGDTLSRRRGEKTDSRTAACPELFARVSFFCLACWIISDDRVQKCLVLDENLDASSCKKLMFQVWLRSI